MTDAVMAAIEITCCCGLTFRARPDPYTLGVTCPGCQSTHYWHYHEGPADPYTETLCLVDPGVLYTTDGGE